ncbi:MAG: hypothetical protein KBT34_13120 [Prevotella sp.]|nr:hypothetical protein [Candidatus Prevotella equi]
MKIQKLCNISLIAFCAVVLSLSFISCGGEDDVLPNNNTQKELSRSDIRKIINDDVVTLVCEYRDADFQKDHINKNPYVYWEFKSSLLEKLSGHTLKYGAIYGHPANDNYIVSVDELNEDTIGIGLSPIYTSSYLSTIAFERQHCNTLAERYEEGKMTLEQYQLNLTFSCNLIYDGVKSSKKGFEVRFFIEVDDVRYFMIETSFSGSTLRVKKVTS